MNTLKIVALLMLSGLVPRTSVTGTTSQTAVVGFGAKIAVQCGTAGFRYQTGTSTQAPVATTNDPFYDPGDPVKIDLPKQHDRIAIIHKDGSTSFTCLIYDRQ